MKVYLDNAATTPIDPEVLEEVTQVMKGNYGNPSSIHAFGRKARSVIEIARKNIAEMINAAPGEVFFTSGGTEADNMAIQCAVNDLGVTRAITSEVEHHAVLHCLQALEEKGEIQLDYVKLTDSGHVDLDDLQKWLKKHEGEKNLVSLMHANNEIGNLLPLEKVGELCEEYNAYFHSDTVQSMGHYLFDMEKLKVHFLTCAAHKFHGPKGVGFLYVNNDVKINPLIHGGAQERNMRGGTENIYGIAGLAKAMEIAHRDMEKHRRYIQDVKDHMIGLLEEKIPGITFNGDAKGNSLYTVLNVHFPPTDKAEMLLFNLDIYGIAVSGGSACTSGSDKGSHVLRALNVDQSRPSIRFSFSKFTTKEEIEYAVEKLKELFVVPVT